MRSLARIVRLLPALVLLCALCGCGGGPAAAPAATGRIAVTLAWPTTGARMIPAATMRIDLTVTAADLAAPLTASLVRPETSLSVTVPVGTGRTVNLTAYDSVGKALAHGAQSGIVVSANQTTAVTITLVGMEDPNTDLAPIPITLASGQGAADGILETTAGAGTDYYTFTGVANTSYAITVECLEVGRDPGASGTLTLTVPGVTPTVSTWNGTTYPTLSRGINVTAAGPVTLAIGATSYVTPPALRYRLTVKEAGGITINITWPPYKPKPI